MAEQDSFWGSVKDLVNAVPVVGAYSQAAWGKGNYDPEAANQPLEPMTIGSTLSGVIPTRSVGYFYQGAKGAPVVGNVISALESPLKFTLDLPNRTFDALWSGAQFSDYKFSTGDEDRLDNFAEGWRRAWDSWGTDQHTSGGEIIAANLTGEAANRVDMFDPDGAKQIEAWSQKTWYGTIAGGVADLAAGFVGPGDLIAPAIKAARAGKTLDTLAKVESASDVFNVASAAGKLDDLKVGRGKAFMRDLAGVEQTGETYAARLRDFAREAVDSGTSRGDAMNFFGPRMAGATEGSKRLMAETAFYLKGLPEEQATHVMANTWLALMGSERAAREVISNAPLVMDKIANATGAPLDLKLVTQAQEVMLRNFETLGEIRPTEVMEQVFHTPQRELVAAELSKARAKALDEAEQVKSIRERIWASRPQLRYKNNDGTFSDVFDVARLKESRLNAETQWRNARTRLAEAKADVKKAESSKLGDEQGLGAAKQRVADLEKEIAEAKSDVDLLRSTPLDDPQAAESWRQSMTAARASTKTAKDRAAVLGSLERITRRQLRDDMAAMQKMSPTINATHLWLTELHAATDGAETMVGMVGGSRLAKLKTAYRDRVGATYLYDNGDYTHKTFFHRMPKETVANIGTAYGHRAVNIHDVYKGQQELPMYLKKSGVFSGDEIRAISEQYLSQGRRGRAELVDKLGGQMTERMLLDAGFDPLQVPQMVKDMRSGMAGARSYLTGRLEKAEATGDRWVRTHEFPGSEGTSAEHMLDASFLRSHLADTVAFPDPSDVKRYIHAHRKEYSTLRLRDTTLRGKDIAVGTVDTVNYWWKVANLVRPGLFFRNMLDTGLRAQMLMGTVPVVASSATGALNYVRNTGLKVGDWTRNSTVGSPLEQMGARLGPANIAKHHLGDKGVEVPIGKGQTRTAHLYEMTDGRATASSVAAVRGASTRGSSMGEGIMGSGIPLHNQLIRDGEKWEKYAATHPQWPVAYREHAEVLLASPASRRLIELEAERFDDLVPNGDLVDEMFKDPKVRAEYNEIASVQGFSREEWVDQLLYEMDGMFPEPGMAEAVLSGRLRGRGADRWIEEHFPIVQRFDIPGRAHHDLQLAAGQKDAANFGKKMIDGFFKYAVDEPDFWLIRHPVMVKAFDRQYHREAAALLAARVKKFGDDAVLTEADLAKIDRRARTHAVSVTKEFMYDSTYNTGLTQQLHRVMPFFNPWYDSMRAYSKLIADDPGRLHTLTGLWNTPANLNQWMPEPIFTDSHGNAIGAGEEPEDGQKFLVLNGLLGKPAGKGGGVKLRWSSFNTILQGEVPWLPGWGPVATIPVTKAVNTDQDVALALSNSDNPLVQTFMKSFWPDGQVPQTGLDNLVNSMVPATWKKVLDWQLGGQTYWTNVQYGINQRYIHSIENGEKWDQKAAVAEAEADAAAAGKFAVISQGIFGLSARSDVDGQFYADRMREYMSMDPALLKQEGYPTPMAKFTEEFPEAAKLKWSFSKNETGIQATVQAQSEANRLRSIIEDNPDLGWFVVGAENIGGDFSQTAYNQQKQFTYGVTDQGRKVLESGDAMQRTLAGVGWDQYTKTADRIEAIGAQMGADPSAVAALKRMVAQQIGADNPQWWEEYNTRTSRVEQFFVSADKIANDPRMASRQDMGMYREYRAVREQVLGMFGLKAFSGTSQNSMNARTVMYQVGLQLAARSAAFGQMWERVLSSEVEPKEAPSGGNG